VVKFGLKPAMGLTLGDSQGPLDQLHAIIDFAKAARDVGFHSIWVGQHYFGGDRIRWEAVPTLARLIPEVEGSIVGTCILLLPLHHPVLVAEQVAILDILSGGRFIFGVGLGYRQREFDGFGVPKRGRASRFEEALSIIRDLWTTDNVRFTGKHFKIDNMMTGTRPLQKPAPPIWIAAHGDNAVKRAARLGDSLMMNPHASLDTLERQLAVYRDALEKESKPFPKELSIRKDIYIARNRRAAWDEAEEEVPRLVRGLTAEGQDRELPESDGFGLREELKDFIRSRYIVGDPDDCIEQIQTHRDRLRLNHFIFRLGCPGGNRKAIMEKIELIGRDVISHFEKEDQP
jgi:alkanesulfonate monooxygenase SsuD/methylene tetrahydromethanopterin reductase-like flavin-dependent oxidoreductase (luciferase family)